MRTFARVLSLTIAAFCTGISLATFFTLVSLKLVLPPIGFTLIAIIAALVAGLRKPPRDWMRLLIPVTLYAIAVTIGYLVFADGASRAAFIDGRYVATYKGQILRTITEEEALQFPNWWTRVSAAWIAIFALAQAASIRPSR